MWLQILIPDSVIRVTLFLHFSHVIQSLCMHLPHVVHQSILPVKRPTALCHAPRARWDVTPELRFLDCVNSVVVSFEFCWTSVRFITALLRIALELPVLENGADCGVRVITFPCRAL
jgi:hypothetical protein